MAGQADGVRRSRPTRSRSPAMQRRITTPRSRPLLPAVLAALLLLACGEPPSSPPAYSGPAQETPAAELLPIHSRPLVHGRTTAAKGVRAAALAAANVPAAGGAAWDKEI